MTAGQSTRRLSNVSLAPASLAALLAATLLGGTLIGAAITLQVDSIDAGAAAIGATAQPAATVDDVRFGAEELARHLHREWPGEVSQLDGRPGGP